MDKFAAALKNLKAFNRTVAASPELSARLVKGDYHFLQWQQGRLFETFLRYHAQPEESRRTVGMSEKIYWKLLGSGLITCLLTAWSALRGKRDVVLFSDDALSAGRDHDFRADGLHQWLRKNDVRFGEVMHTVLGKKTLTNALARQRSAIYHEALEFLAMLWFRHSRCHAESRQMAEKTNFQEFEEADRPFVRVLLAKILRSAPASRFKIRWYRRILKCMRPRAVLSVDDTRYYHELCAAARLEGIPFYAFQHGCFTKYHAGWLATGAGKGNDTRPDALFVWSPYWKNELLRLGTNFRDEEIRVGGNPKSSVVPEKAGAYAPPKVGGRVDLLVPFETEPPLDELRGMLARLIETGRVKIWLKTRPDWNTEEQMRRYGLLSLSSEQAEAVPDHRPILEKLHAVAGVHSTFLYDMLPSMRPVFIFDTSMDYAEGMIKNGLADAFNVLGDDPVERLIELCRLAAPKLQERLERYQGGSGELTATLESLLRSTPERPFAHA